MLVYESAEPKNGESWHNGFATRLKTKDARRLAAMSLAWPTASGTVLNPDRPSYNAMTTFWDDDSKQHRKLAASLMALKGLADTHVGQSVAVFTKGSPDSIQRSRGGLVTPVGLQIGVVAPRASADGTGVLDYQYAAPRIQHEEDKNRPRPSLRLSVGVGITGPAQSLSVSEFGTSRVITGDPAPDGNNSVGVLEGEVTFSEEPGDYELFRRLRESHVLFGNEAVNGFLARLALYENGDARDNWRSLDRSPEELTPDLSQIFGVAA